jgi:lysophospholipase L1-like esterase
MIFNLFLLVSFLVALFQATATIRVTCIGDSITEGGACNSNGYVPILQNYLGGDYLITNAGRSSQTQLKRGLCNDLTPCSYWNTSAWTVALESDPDIVTIMLGTNDAKFFNWEGIQQDTGDYFALDYVDMIRKVRSLKSHPEVFIMVPPPLLQPVFDMNMTVINEIFPTLVKDIGTVIDTPIIDIYSAMLPETYRGTDLLCDGCHPTAYGNDLIAQTMYPYIVEAAKKRMMKK